MVDLLKTKYHVDVEWRPFYLRPDTPPEGADLPDYVLRARANGSEGRLQSMAESYGMPFRSTERIYNTRLAHEATEYAREHGRGNEFHHDLFRKVYADRLDPANWSVLRDSASQCGLDADEMQNQVEAGKYTVNVAEQVQTAYQIGVTGVPTYVVNGRYAVVGAQPYSVFEQLLERLKSGLIEK